MDSNMTLSVMTCIARIHAAVYSRLKRCCPDYLGITVETNAYFDAMTHLFGFQATSVGVSMQPHQLQIAYLHTSFFKYVLAKQFALCMGNCAALEDITTVPGSCVQYTPRGDAPCDFLALRIMRFCMAVASLMGGALNPWFVRKYITTTSDNNRASDETRHPQSGVAHLNVDLRKMRAGNYPSLTMLTLAMLETLYFRVTGTHDRLTVAYHRFMATECWDYLQAVIEHGKHFSLDIYTEHARAADEDIAITNART
ncbi:hypothetical protein SARC_17633, partial [Sphaeroforma arctica JP610]